MSQATLAQENWTGNQQVSLLDLLDRLLEKGVVVDGEILLTVADIDLVYLGLKCILSSVETLKKGSSNNPLREIRNQDGGEDDEDVIAKTQHFQPKVLGTKQSPSSEIASPPKSLADRNDDPNIISADTPPRKDQAPCHPSEKEDLFFKDTPAKGAAPNPTSRNKINIESEKVEKGLVKLVLTVVELLRKLMERQAIRRIEGGSLRPGKMEELGLAFLRLDEKMEELKKFFGLKDEDLNLNLGPLGNLV